MLVGCPAAVCKTVARTARSSIESIDADRSADENVGLALGVAIAGAQQRLQPGIEFLGVEGLGKIIVGTRGKTRDPVRNASERTDHQHRSLEARAAPVRQRADRIIVAQ